MSKPTRIVCGVALIFYLLSFATCHFGVEYDRSRLPPDEEGVFVSCCWCEPVGTRWMRLGEGIFLVAFSVSIGAVIYQVRESYCGQQKIDLITINLAHPLQRDKVVDSLPANRTVSRNNSSQEEEPPVSQYDASWRTPLERLLDSLERF